ncbi:hypothetical protein P154DRAFT_600976 [Amniculicola lignicola CBS 123094]|uniref:3-carboxymuconate cyclase n=1 Tax=Amniculicola lignicola CBS 123094 TaxID=1392246 RepID=A0A6A5WEW3_9PLEO|nr:hypothetical protein P154DRAFT_600976 [Amniculicola lignicola CBS 123094]
MPSLSTAISLALLASGILASPVSIDVVLARRQAASSSKNGKAAYVLTNGEENAIAAVAIRANGKLGKASVTKTGGCGSSTVDAQGKIALPDALVGQSALTIAGQVWVHGGNDNIFAVNAGSNTISMLAISAEDPLLLTPVGTPAALPGTFPNTIAASAKNGLVCVGTTGSKSGISCGTFDTVTGIGQMDALRPFDLGQSDPPVGPTNTVSQTFFSEDESMLFTTVKGDPMVNKTGFLSVFSVQSGAASLSPNASANACGEAVVAGGAPAQLSIEETRSSPPGTAVLFGSAPILGTSPPQIFATDASFGAGILTLSPDMSSTLTAKQAIADQKATCWATISALTKTAFVTDVGINRIVEMSLQDASILNTIDLSKETPDPGLIDLRAAGGFVYALSPGNGTTPAAISVVDVRSKKLVQHAKLGKIGVGATAMGMAILI